MTGDCVLDQVQQLQQHPRRPPLGRVRQRGEPIQITPEGGAAIGDDWEPLPTGDALAEHWMRQLGKAERTILSYLLDAFPTPCTKDDISTATGCSTPSSFSNALGRLRSLEPVNRDRASWPTRTSQARSAVAGMRALTIRQPWAWAIALAGNDAENHTGSTS